MRFPRTGPAPRFHARLRAPSLSRPPHVGGFLGRIIVGARSTSRAASGPPWRCARRYGLPASPRHEGLSGRAAGRIIERRQLDQGLRAAQARGQAASLRSAGSSPSTFLAHAVLLGLPVVAQARVRDDGAERLHALVEVGAACVVLVTHHGFVGQGAAQGDVASPVGRPRCRGVPWSCPPSPGRAPSLRPPATRGPASGSCRKWPAAGPCPARMRQAGRAWPRCRHWPASARGRGCRPS